MHSVPENLHPRIREMLASLGIDSLTDPQEKGIPIILSGKNSLIIAPTGSGKTEAAIMPIFDRILKTRPERISTLFITPLRALNRDMLGRLVKYGNFLGLRVQVRHSDTTTAARKEIVENPGDILVTTPESLQILLVGKRSSEVLKHVRYVIVDELHESCQNERGSQFSVALERLEDLAGKFQRIGLSATIGNPEELSSYLSPRDPVEVVKSDSLKKMSIRTLIPAIPAKEAAEKMGCDEDHASAILEIWRLIESHKGTLVFVNTRNAAEDIAFRLRMLLKDPQILVHHGSLSREERENAEKEFKNGRVKALICTSSLELGIDIGSADFVIQFNSPRQINKLIQRVGRSGHSIGKTSEGYIVCGDIIELEESIALVSQANDRHLEPVQIQKKSLATVANQLLMELRLSRDVDAQMFYSTVKRAYPFMDLQESEYNDVLSFLERIHRIYLERNVITRRRGAIEYFVQNISMIPSQKTFKVIDLVNRKFIGTLDEKYVVSEIEPGSYFVIKGSTWRVIKMEGERILVEPFQTAAIAPKWSGDDIPVFTDVTMRVSENRKSHFLPEFLGSKSTNILQGWYKNNLATFDNVVIECKSNEIVIQILLGTKGNFALAEILSSTITRITGESVEMDYSPYHIYLRSSRMIRAEDVRRIILSINPDSLYDYITAISRRSRFFNSVFLYEARKFGVISNDTDLSRMRFEKIVDAYSDSPLFGDAVRKFVFDYMDLEVLEVYLRELISGAVSMSLSDTFTGSTEQFLTHYSERVAPLRPTKVILEAIKNRLLNDEVVLLCTSCGNVRTQKIKDIVSIKCPNCGSYLVASLSAYEKNMMDKEKNPTEREKWRRRMVKNAHLVKERGIYAVMVLSGRGIGPETASRLLEVRHQNEDDLIRAILNSEMEYAKNRRYWD